MPVRRRPPVLVFLWIVAWGALLPRAALACATCLAGDPTLSTLGLEKPYAGRLRVTAGFLHRTETVGVAGLNRKELNETRALLGLAWWPRSRLALGIQVPWVFKHLTRVDTGSERVSAPGDLQVYARYYGWQWGGSRRHHLLAMNAGLRIPTAVEQTADGPPLDFDVQPGTGQWVPSLGLWYALYAYPWFTSLQLTGQWGLGTGFQGYQFGGAVNLSLLGQRALTQRLAIQLALDTRWNGRDDYHGRTDPDSGGYIGFLTPGLVVNLSEDWLVSARVQVPVVDALNGAHEEGIVVRAEVSYDF